MKKAYLHFEEADSVEEIHEVIASALDFPPYYGRNLDALYDCLTDLRNDICIGIYGPVAWGLREYFLRVTRVFCDAEKENPHLCVFSFTDRRSLR